MKKLAIMFLFSLAIFACENNTSTDDASKKTNKPEVVAPMGESQISTIVDGIDKDLGLQIEHAESVLGDVTFTILKYKDQGNQLRKVFSRASSAYGEEEYVAYYPAANEGNSPIYSRSVNHQKLCDDDRNVCYTEVKNYYDKGNLLSSKSKKGTYSPLEHKRFNPESLSEVDNPMAAEQIKTDDQNQLSEIEKLTKDASVTKAKRFLGEYLYVADTHSFMECATKTSFSVESYKLEVAYSKENAAAKPVFADVVGTIKVVEGMENGKLEKTLFVYQINNLNKNKRCDK